MTLEEQELIEQLFRQMYNYMLSYAISSLRNNALAEEAVQETFRIACQKPEALFTSPSPKGWLIKVLRNTVYNARRNRSNANMLLQSCNVNLRERTLGVEDSLSLDVTYQNLAKTDEFQLIVEMAVEGRSHLEMAKKRGISVNACKKRVERAKKYLKKKFSCHH